MSRTIRTLGFVLVVVSSLLLSACGSQAQPTATKDPKVVYTEAAQAVATNLAKNATPVPPATATVAASPTTAATATLAPSSTSVSLPTSASVQTTGTKTTGTVTAAAAGTTATATATRANGAATTPSGSSTQAANLTVTPTLAMFGTPTMTSTAAPRAAAPDKAELIGQSPEDKTKVNAGNGFRVTWTLRNSGTTTWNANYSLKYWGGTRMEGSLSIPVTKDVKPGETFAFTTDMAAPSTSGPYNVIYYMQNADGQNFMQVFLLIDVP